MIPQGSVILNTSYFDGLKARIDAANNCSELQTLATECMGSLNANVAALQAQLALLQPMLALLTGPSANLTAIVQWIQSFITSYLTQQLLPYQTYTTQLPLMIAQIQGIVSELQSKSASFPSCSITIPPVG